MRLELNFVGINYFIHLFFLVVRCGFKVSFLIAFIYFLFLPLFLGQFHSLFKCTAKDDTPKRPTSL